MRKKIGEILFINGTIFDPWKNKQEQSNILVVKGRIEEVGKIDPISFSGEVVDISGQWVVPGLIDTHSHLREPGREDEETLESGSEAAMAGGFTSVCCMPNTSPPIDTQETVKFIKDRTEDFLIDVYPIAAISKGLQGKELTEMAELVKVGAVAFSDDGNPLINSGLMRRALEYTKMLNVSVIDHCEDPSLSQKGVMNEGYTATCLGFRGIPSISEEAVVARDLLLAAFTGGRLHIAHVSTAGSVHLIREAKDRGVQVTCEVCPHHFTLTDDAVRTFDPNTKMNPPLRTAEDVVAIHAGLKDGTIDVIASDHAPHSIEEKEVEYDAAAFGIIGLETALGLAITKLVDVGVLSLKELISKMVVNPSKILGLRKEAIIKGATANFTIFDPKKEWIVQAEKFKSKSHNSPFVGWKLKGEVFGVYNKGQWCQVNGD